MNMKFTIAVVGLLTITSTLAIQDKKNEDLKGKRQTSEGYGSSHNYQLHQPSQGDGNSVSIGAGYNVGGSKPAFTYSSHNAGPSYHIPSDASHGRAQQTVQLAPITLQPSQGSFIGSDLSQLMSQLSHGLSSGALSLEPAAGGGYQLAGQDLALPQYTFGAPNLQHSDPMHAASVPQYAADAKGLGTYGSTGPVLFNPSDSQYQQAPQAIAYAAPAALNGHALAAFTHASPHSSSYGGAGHSFGGLAGSGAHSFGGISLGSIGHGSSIGSLKGLNAGYGGSGKLHAFKPSAYLGSLGDSGNAASFSASPASGHSLPGLHGGFSLGPSGGLNFGSLSGYGGSSKHTYQPVKAEAPLPSLSSASSSSSHSHGAPSSLYSLQSSGSPSSSYTLSNNAHASSSPQYYVASTKGATSASFAEGSSYKSPASSSGLNAYGHSPKYSFSSFTRYAPKDAQGSYSDTVYNTIKYSEELKPRSYVHKVYSK